jgi:hypothetical protein
MTLEMSNAVALSLIFFGGFACLAYAVTAWLRRVRRAEEAAAHWRMADAEIISVEVIRHRDSDGDEYEPRVRYAYRVAGRRFEGEKLRIGAKIMMNDKYDAQLSIAKYFAGDRIQIRYDPDKPQRSVLEPVPTPSGLWQWVVFGIFLLASGAYIAVTLTFPAPWEN